MRSINLLIFYFDLYLLLSNMEIRFFTIEKLLRLLKISSWFLFPEEAIYQTENKPRPEEEEDEPMEEDDSLKQLFVESCRSHDTAEKPDEVNFRFYLWKSMRLFPELCEKKNRDLVPLFFDFIRFVTIHNWLLKFCV